MTVVPETARTGSVPGSLHVLRDLFARVHDQGIRYCHWKSNEHLDATMIGATDVDVLFERQAAQRLTRLLTDTTSFKRFVVKPGHGYPGIEDYVGFDPDTGALTHLHVHYQLTLGEKFLKGHRVPWEELYLSTRVLDATHGIYVSDPSLELVVILLRAVMKLRARDTLLAAIGKPFFRGGLLRELRWLVTRAEPQRVLDVASQLVGPRAAALIPEMLAAPHPTLGQLHALRRLAVPKLDAYRMYGPVDAARRMAGVEWSIVLWKIRHWLSGAPTRSNRTIPQGGVHVAFVGAPDAGTTALIREVARWVSREVAVTIARTGSDSDPVSLPRRLWQRLWGRGARRPGRPTAPPTHSSPQVRRAVGRGMIVLSDHSAAGQSSDSAGRADVSPRSSEFSAPHLVIQIHRSDVPVGQRTSEPAVHLPSTTQVVNVDSDQPFPQLLLAVKRAIWECI